MGIRRHVTYFKRLPIADRVQIVLSTLIKLSLFSAFVIAAFSGDWTVAFVSVAALVATLLPWFLAHSLEIRFPVGFEFALVLFVYATLFLGEAHGFYTKFWWWDVVLHAGSAMAFGFSGFLILYSLNRNGRFQAPPSLIVFLSFSVAMAIGALWEIFEFTMDNLFGLNMQKSGLKDTMWDLIVDTGGGLVTSVSGYLYLKFRTRGLGIFRYYVKSYFKARKLQKAK